MTSLSYYIQYISFTLTGKWQVDYVYDFQDAGFLSPLSTEIIPLSLHPVSYMRNRLLVCHFLVVGNLFSLSGSL